MHVANVTLVGIAWHRKYIEELFAAYQQFQKSIRFEQTILFVDEPVECDAHIRIIPLPDYFSLEEKFQLPLVGPVLTPKLNPYNYFVMKDVARYIQTSHVLFFQNDGWVANPQAWDSIFLQYDYVGAIWPWSEAGKRVGNGGFSLRSKRLCGILAADENIVASAPEDIHICINCREYLEQVYGIKFAPDEVANRFSVEFQHYKGQFGFHGKWHLQNIPGSMSEFIRGASRVE